MQDLIDLFNSPDGAVEVQVDGNNFSQQDVDYLLLFPYIIKDLEPREVYEIGNLKVKIK